MVVEAQLFIAGCGPICHVHHKRGSTVLISFMKQAASMNLAPFGAVEACFDHHGLHDRNPRGRNRDACDLHVRPSPAHTLSDPYYAPEIGRKESYHPIVVLSRKCLLTTDRGLHPAIHLQRTAQRRGSSWRLTQPASIYTKNIRLQ